MHWIEGQAARTRPPLFASDMMYNLEKVIGAFSFNVRICNNKEEIVLSDKKSVGKEGMQICTDDSKSMHTNILRREC